MIVCETPQGSHVFSMIDALRITAILSKFIYALLTIA